MRVFLRHRGQTTALVVGRSSQLALDPAREGPVARDVAPWRGVFADRDGALTLYLVPGSLPTRYLPRAGAPRALANGAVQPLAIGDAVELGHGCTITVGYRTQDLPRVRPLDPRERALLADEPDAAAGDVLRDHWEELGEDRAASAAVSLAIAAGFDLAEPAPAPLLLDAGEPLAAHDAIFRVSPRVYVADAVLAASDALTLCAARVLAPAGPTGARVAIRCARETTPETTAYLTRAQRLAARLAHPNLEQLVGGVTGREGRGLAWAWAGASLASLVAAAQAGGPGAVAFGAPFAHALARQLAAGLAAAHARGVVHRHVSPPRICIAADGTARLIGFAEARADGLPHWADAQTLGAGAVDRYTAPERLAGDAYDGRADLYSLGAVLRELAPGDAMAEGLCAPDPARRVAPAQPADDRDRAILAAAVRALAPALI